MFDLFEQYVNKVFLTEVFANVEGDAFFTREFTADQWKVRDEKELQKNEKGDQYNSRFSIFDRRVKNYRFEPINRFFTDNLVKDKWLSTQVNKNISKIVNYGHENLVLDI